MVQTRFTAIPIAILLLAQLVAWAVLYGDQRPEAEDPERPGESTGNWEYPAKPMRFDDIFSFRTSKDFEGEQEALHHASLEILNDLRNRHDIVHPLFRRGFVLAGIPN